MVTTMMLLALQVLLGFTVYGFASNRPPLNITKASYAGANLTQHEYLPYYVQWTEDPEVINYIDLFVDSDKVQLYEFPNIGPQFWLIHFTKLEMLQFTNNFPDAFLHEEVVIADPDGIVSKNKNKLLNDAVKATEGSNEGDLCDKSAPDDLAFLSWTGRRPLSSHKCYKYRQHPQDQVKIYLIDTGVNNNLEEFRSVNIWYHYGPGVIEYPSDGSSSSHGTCVASKMVGNRFGVSKRQELHVIKILDFTNAGIHWAFAYIASKIAQHKQTSIVVYPASSHEKYDSAGRTYLGKYYDRILQLGKAISKYKGIIVTGAGRHHLNVGGLVDTQPAIAFAGNKDVNAVIVGATDLKGVTADFSGFLDPAVRAFRNKQVWAPGVSVVCQSREDHSQTIKGVSPSIGMVAGLLAYLIAIGQYHFFEPGAKQIVDHWTSKRTARSGRYVIFNGLDGSADAVDSPVAMESNTTSIMLPSNLSGAKVGLVTNVMPVDVS